MIRANQTLVKQYTDILSKRYQSPLIEIDESFSREHLNMTLRTAKQKAAAQQLPFPASKRHGYKSNYVVAVEALANWMASKSIEAEAEWNSVQRGAA